MVYTAFLDTLTEALQEKLGPSHTLTIHPVLKNNGVRLDGLCVDSRELQLSPTIYLNPYYDQYCEGMTLEEITDDILDLFRANPPSGCIAPSEILDFEKMRPRIMMKLIHASSNRDLLADVPHIPYLDLAIVFYLFLERSDSGQMTAMICNQHCDIWNKSNQDLLRLALANTPVIYPAQLRSMNTVMKEIAMQSMGDRYDEQLLDRLLDSEDTPPLYVLTNQSGIFGASCMLYRSVLKNFADYLKSDLIIIPSSIHEVLITPDGDGVSYEILNEMIAEINSSDVPAEDILSDHIYLYSRADGRISL